MSATRDVARAIDALRRGWPIAIHAPGEAPLTLLPIETADAARLDAFDPAGSAHVLLSFGRAETLRIVNQRAAAEPDQPVSIRREGWTDFAAATALADPQLDLATPMKGPFRGIEIARPGRRRRRAAPRAYRRAAAGVRRRGRGRRGDDHPGGDRRA